MLRLKFLFVLLIALSPMVLLGFQCESGGGIASVKMMEACYGQEFHYALSVALEPSGGAKADVEYWAKCYKNGTSILSYPISWNQPEVNAKTWKIVEFPLDKQEFQAYNYLSTSDLKKIFTVRVSETK